MTVGVGSLSAAFCGQNSPPKNENVVRVCLALLGAQKKQHKDFEMSKKGKTALLAQAEDRQKDAPAKTPLAFSNSAFLPKARLYAVDSWQLPLFTPPAENLS